MSASQPAPQPSPPPKLQTDTDRTQRIAVVELPTTSGQKIPGLLVIEGMNLGSIYRLERGVYLAGRSTEAHIHIDNYLVSRFHAEFRVLEGDPLRCLIRDLGSTNGTLVNDAPMTEKLLQDGDKIRIGDHVLKYMFQDEQDLRYHARVHQMIRYDDLTGLLTKASFYRELRREISRARRRSHALSVLMLDLDHFKSVNDTYGHLVGSSVLQQFGALMLDTFRDLDVSGRYGGEEFITFFPETSKQDAKVGAERFRRRVEGHEFRYRDLTLSVTVSIGIAALPEDGHELESLVRKADRALYEAKKLGRNQACLYSL